MMTIIYVAGGIILACYILANLGEVLEAVGELLRGVFWLAFAAFVALIGYQEPRATVLVALCVLTVYATYRFWRGEE